MNAQGHELAFFTEDYGSFSTEFVRRHLKALDSFRPFVACWSRSHRDVFDFEPMHEFVPTRRRDRVADALLHMIPGPLRWTDSLSASRVAAELLRHYRPRAALVHFGWMAARISGALHAAGVPYVVVLHGSDVNLAIEHPNSTYARKLRVAFRRSWRCLYVSEHLRRKGLSLGCPENRALVHYLGVPVPDLVADARRQSPVTIVCVGRLSPVKGHAFLIDAMHEVVRGHKDVQLRIIGEGELRPELEARIRALKLQDNVILLGEHPNERVMQEMRSAQILVHPSISLPGFEEGLGLVVQEAMAAGLPVVSTLTGGLPESIEQGRTGLMVAPGDVSALAAAITSLVKDPARRAAMGAAGRERVIERFSMTRQNEVLGRIVEEMIAPVRS